MRLNRISIDVDRATGVSDTRCKRSKARRKGGKFRQRIHNLEVGNEEIGSFKPRGSAFGLACWPSWEQSEIDWGMARCGVGRFGVWEFGSGRTAASAGLVPTLELIPTGSCPE